MGCTCSIDIPWCETKPIYQYLIKKITLYLLGKHCVTLTHHEF